jgi:hypothetical protein
VLDFAADMIGTFRNANLRLALRALLRKVGTGFRREAMRA